ncbi:hypothetical protein TDMWS_17960 [Thermodesulfomicrobium sp. WS]|uniref:hypothetical protein n=1 Tax=Thermodesulfomicrobium sp. WS TaxID=3004129 RepID=UPI002493625B|nr:hypothetical protein [Thermodesulfomicrobium sp. WS]BDV01711.1 hypothetical protein TDMWS_17960 [Thermodesulfomicrobium sp. WS]
MKRCGCLWTPLAAVLLWACAAHAAGPLEAVDLINRSIETQNPALLERAVDLSALSSHVVAGVARQLAADPPLLEHEPLAVLVARLVGTGQQEGEMRRVLAEEGRRYLVWGVASGAFAGRSHEEVPREGLLAAVLAQVSPGRKELRAAQVVEEEGASSVVEVDLVDHGTGAVYPLALRLVRLKEGWRVVAVLNVESLVARIRAEARTP